MGKVTITDEAGTPGTPADGLTLYAVAGVLYYKDDGGVVHKVSDSPGGALVTNEQLIAWTETGAYQIVENPIIYDATYPELLSNDATNTVTWPDGSSGEFAVTAYDTTWEAIKAYTISHVLSSKTVTQAAITRDGTSGNVTIKPALTVA